MIMRNDEEILKKFLEIEAKKVVKRIEKTGNLNTKDASVLSLKYLFNHVSELDIEIKDIKRNMATKDDIKNIWVDLKNIWNTMATKNDIKLLKWMWGIGVGFIAVLVTILSIFVK